MFAFFDAFLWCVYDPVFQIKQMKQIALLILVKVCLLTSIYISKRIGMFLDQRFIQWNVLSKTSSIQNENGFGITRIIAYLFWRTRNPIL